MSRCVECAAPCQALWTSYGKGNISLNSWFVMPFSPKAPSNAEMQCKMRGLLTDLLLG
jgi:hypothetical protein